MRKYRQLFLIAAVLLSVCVLLVYRNEYMKLRQTFEIISVFNEPVKPTDCIVLNETVADRYIYRNLFSNPSPRWTNVGENHVYSAFWQSEGEKGNAKAIGVGPAASNKNYDCSVWFDLQDSLTSQPGTFSYSSIARTENSSLTLYEFVCEIELKPQGVPYMFVFSSWSQSSTIKAFIPIFTAELNQSWSPVNRTALCIRPDMIGRTKNEIIEFVNFHQVVGLSDIIIYDIGIHYGILSKLKMLQGLNSFIRSVSVLTWNIPFDDSLILNKALELDCIYRTSGKVQVVSILNWNQYLVPRVAGTILSMLNEYSLNRSLTLNVPIQLCCFDMKNEKHAESSWPIALRKSHCLMLSQFAIMLINPKLTGYAEKQMLKFSTGNVNEYDVCNEDQKLNSRYDSGTLHFASDVLTNNLLRIWRSGVLFTQD